MSQEIDTAFAAIKGHLRAIKIMLAANVVMNFLIAAKLYGMIG